jgi:CubicO group peptidase (beta-lactamase class C family)
MDAVRQIDAWDVPNAAVAVLGPQGELGSRGDRGRVYRLASVTKLMTALASLVAAEEGVVDLDEPAGPPGSTIRHLLAHASGLPFEGDGPPLARPGTRRIYSNVGFEVLGDAVAERAEMPFAEYLCAAVFEPLAMTRTQLRESAAAGVQAPLDDLVRFTRELLEPRLVSTETLAEATSVQFPGLAGILPGVGRYDPLDWGLGFELKDAKKGHWSGECTSPRAFGHFGGSGTFLWVDPGPEIACVCLTDRGFGPWALEAWPRFSDAVLAEAA